MCLIFELDALKRVSTIILRVEIPQKKKDALNCASLQEIFGPLSLCDSEPYIYYAVIANGFKLNLYSFGLQLNFCLKILEK